MLLIIEVRKYGRLSQDFALSLSTSRTQAEACLDTWKCGLASAEVEYSE